MHTLEASSSPASTPSGITDQVETRVLAYLSQIASASVDGSTSYFFEFCQYAVTVEADQQNGRELRSLLADLDYGTPLKVVIRTGDHVLLAAFPTSELPEHPAVRYRYC